jgi:hypothetical protein
MYSLYAKFVKETLNWNTLEDDESFVTYEIQERNKDRCLKIYEMFIDQKARGKNKSKDLLDKLKTIALENNCNLFSAQISQTAPEFIKQRSVHICRLFGMKKTYEDSMVILYCRGL